MTHPSGKSAKPLSGELDILTFLRFLAAIWVVFHHLGFWPLHLGPMATVAAQNLFERGGTGVKFFFILSGFILTHVYGRRPTIDRREFLFARFARLYPVYLLGLVVGFPMLVDGFREHVAHHSFALGAGVASVKALAVLTLTQAWFPSSALFWNGVSWSLSTEALFYVAFPTLLFFFRGRSTRGLFGILGLCLALEAARQWGSATHPSIAWGFTPPLRLPDFATGIAIRLLLDRGFSVPAWLSIPAATGFVLLQTLGVPSTGLLVLHQLATHLLVAVLICSLAIPRQGAKPRVRMRPLVFAGQISYSLYLLHHPVMKLWKAAFPQWTTDHFGSFLTVLLLVCSVVYLFVESPAREAIRAWARRSKASATA